MVMFPHQPSSNIQKPLIYIYRLFDSIKRYGGFFYLPISSFFNVIVRNIIAIFPSAYIRTTDCRMLYWFPENLLEK